LCIFSDSLWGAGYPLIALFLALSLASSLIALPVMGFTLRRSYGIYLLSLYPVFLLATILLEVGHLPLDWLPASRPPQFEKLAVWIIARNFVGRYPIIPSHCFMNIIKYLHIDLISFSISNTASFCH
jgi:hypothetical protein